MTGTDGSGVMRDSQGAAKPQLGGGVVLLHCRFLRGFQRVGTVGDVIERVPELLEHVAQRRLGAGDAGDLLVVERVDAGESGEVGKLLESGSEPGLDDAADEIAGRRFEAERLDGAVAGHVHRVVEAVLDVAVQGRDEAVPQAALGEDEEADAVELVHGLDDTGEERLGDAMAVVGTADEQQVFHLVEGDHDRDLQSLEDLHQYLEQGQDEVLACGPDLEFEFGKAEGEEIGEVGLIAEQGGAGKPLVDVMPHVPGRVVRLEALDVLTHESAGLVDVEPRFGAECRHAGAARRRPGRVHEAMGGRGAARQLIDDPLRAFLGLGAAEAEMPRPACQSRRREQVKALR